MDSIDVSYKDLITAIILQAICDYKKHKSQRAEIEKFFLSKWYSTLCEYDGKRLIKDLRKVKK